LERISPGNSADELTAAGISGGGTMGGREGEREGWNREEEREGRRKALARRGERGGRILNSCESFQLV